MITIVLSLLCLRQSFKWSLSHKAVKSSKETNFYQAQWTKRILTHTNLVWTRKEKSTLQCTASMIICLRLTSMHTTMYQLKAFQEIQILLPLELWTWHLTISSSLTFTQMLTKPKQSKASEGEWTITQGMQPQSPEKEGIVRPKLWSLPLSQAL